MPDTMPERVSDRMSKYVPERMSGRMSEYMPDRMFQVVCRNYARIVCQGGDHWKKLVL